MKYSTELLLKFVFEASHSLAGYEKPHPHLWNLEVTIKGNPIDGKVIDIVQLRECIQRVIQLLAMTYLNENQNADDAVRAFPTCETLSVFFADQIDAIVKGEFLSQNPSVSLKSVLVAICDMDGTETGAVRVSI